MTKTNFPTALRFLALYAAWRSDSLTADEERAWYLLEAALS